MEAEELKLLPIAVQKFLARHPQTSSATLDALSRESSTEVQVLVARHSQTPFAALEHLLSLDKDEITQALSFNTRFTASVEAHREIYRRLEKWLVDLQKLKRLRTKARYGFRSARELKSEMKPSRATLRLCRSIARYNTNIHFSILLEQLGTPEILQNLTANRNIPPTMLDKIFLKMGPEFGNKPSSECLRCMYHLSTNPYSSTKALKLLGDTVANILSQKMDTSKLRSEFIIFPWETVSGIAAGLVINPSTPESTKDMLTQQLIS